MGYMGILFILIYLKPCFIYLRGTICAPALLLQDWTGTNACSHQEPCLSIASLSKVLYVPGPGISLLVSRCTSAQSCYVWAGDCELPKQGSRPSWFLRQSTSPLQPGDRWRQLWILHPLRLKAWFQDAGFRF